MTSTLRPRAAGVLVTDFDGTVTKRDFYRLALARLIPPDVPDYWGEYRAGRLTHFEALRNYFAHIRADPSEVERVVAEAGIDPRFRDKVRALAESGWRVAIVSAGCAWYIRKLLDAAGALPELEPGGALELFANPGRFEPGRGLIMEPPPADAPHFCRELGIDKAGVVRGHLAAGRTVAFAGDGFPDFEAASLAPAELRFARADLAEALDAAGVPYRSFDVWSEVADALLARTAP